MIKYDRLWEYLKKSGVTQYRLIVSGISTSTISRLKHNQPVTTETLDKLCTILDCGLDEIVEFEKEK
ncbi:MAG: helix-turn-helix transcriptional regulator [Lachnospiraceae bacterium]|nr:helix-turn-helix transcriptional regulator [Lachnospiraceae bacterium]